MKEVVGDAWSLANKFDVLCITTNGQIDKNNELVMGKGIALTCKTKYPQIPGLLAQYVIQYGNRVFNLGKDGVTGVRLASFPTKNHWRDKSDINLIKSSAIQLVEMANANGWTKVLLTRPGCGCGQLDWNHVRQVLSNIFDDRFYIISNNPNDIPMSNNTQQSSQVIQQQSTSTAPKKKVLECSTKGDKRFSASCANVEVFGVVNTIEKHYQLCKRFDGSDTPPDDWRYCKGKTPSHIILNGMKLDSKYLSQWYKALWLNYLDRNPDLVEYASTFDDYNDIFKGKSVNCQADVIRQYIKEGRESLVRDTQELRSLFISTPTIPITPVQPIQHEQPPSFDTVLDEIDNNTIKITTPVINQVESKYKTLCVTGHRPKDLWGYSNNAKYQQLQNKIYYCVRQFYQEYNVRTCTQGGAQGVDQLFGEVCTYIRDNEFRDLSVEVAIPFVGQENAWLERGKFSKSEYRNMISNASACTVVCPNVNTYSPKNDIVSALFQRNEYMVSNSDYVLGIYSGDINNVKLSTNKNSGTLHALQSAYKLGKPIVVINPFTLVATRINF